MVERDDIHKRWLSSASIKRCQCAGFCQPIPRRLAPDQLTGTGRRDLAARLFWSETQRKKKFETQRSTMATCKRHGTAAFEKVGRPFGVGFGRPHRTAVGQQETLGLAPPESFERQFSSGSGRRNARLSGWIICLASHWTLPEERLLRDDTCPVPGVALERRRWTC
jgi:hypothetical protein